MSDIYEERLIDGILQLAAQLADHRNKKSDQELERERPPDGFGNEIFADFKAGKRIYPRLEATQEQHIENLINESETKNAKKAAKNSTKGEQTMPPKFSDGSFREVKSRKSGLIEYRFMHEGKPESVYGHSYQECWSGRAEFIANGGKRKNKPKTSRTIKSFAEWLNHWYAVYKEPRNGKASLKAIRSYLDKDIIPAIGTTPLSALTHDALQEFLNKFASADKQKRIYDILRGALARAVVARKIPYNPAEGLERTPHKRTPHAALQVNQQRELYAAIAVPKYRSLFMFACCTGIRIGRILELDQSNIDRRANEITVLMKQKRGLTETYSVPFLDELLAGLPAGGKLFPDITLSGAEKYFKKLFKKLGFEGITIHSFRHTFISTLYHIGVRDKQIQAWAGHKNLSMTMDVYTHIIKDNGTSPVLDYLLRLKNELNV
jgi:integrase